MTTTTNGSLGQPTLVALEAEELWDYGQRGPASELLVTLFWDQRCLACGRRVSSPLSTATGLGEHCRRNKNRK